jgi:glycogen operon protein
MGDEVRRTQHGNNNAYCLDDETSWFDWSLIERHGDVRRFVQRLIAARMKTHPDHDLSLNQLLREARITWHGVRLGAPDWGKDSRSLAATAWGRGGKLVFHFMFNAWREELEFELPEAPPGVLGGWVRWIDTALSSPDDVRPLAEAPSVDARAYRLAAHSLAVLVGVLGPGKA